MVRPANWRAVRLFLHAPWEKNVGMGGLVWLGINWGQLDDRARWAGIELADADRPALYQQLTEMAGAAMKILNKPD